MMISSEACYLAGMPQLNFTGLSENWLLKECGHRHWEALARESGRTVPDFVADDGSRAYAAFTSVRMRAHAFDEVGENDEFTMQTTLSRTGAVRHFSEHRIASRKGAIADVLMSSTFVRRTQAGNNRSVARATFARLAGDIAPPPSDASGMHATAKLLRAGAVAPDVERLFGQACDREPVEFLPCPNSDFNGADFLYFASFQAFVDRAEWHAHRFLQPPVLADRDLYFHANINVGDTLRVRFMKESKEPANLAHWCAIFRASDGARIADVVTRKRWRKA